ncbi:MAG: hypothetical protein V2L15_01895 [Desulfobacteraceae bacterium]|jgi:hypothetical protein|nr:hypothetical protein [Desulfobacteraceae bacterium]
MKLSAANIPPVPTAVRRFETSERLDLLQTLRRRLSSRDLLTEAMGFRSKGKDLAMANLNLVDSSLKGVTPLPELGEVTSLLRQCGLENIEVHRFMPGGTF